MDATATRAVADNGAGRGGGARPPGGRDVSARILAVDDVSHNLDLMTYLLQACGHEVVGASTGAQALRLAGERRPDLIVLDVQLADMDGYEVLERLRADPDLAGVPVIAVTAYAMVGDRDHALATGFDGYLAKPIDPTSLADAVAAFLPEDRRGHPPRPTTDATEGPAWPPS
jgi:CheY-like chemotaxis protein